MVVSDYSIETVRIPIVFLAFVQIPLIEIASPHEIQQSGKKLIVRVLHADLPSQLRNFKRVVIAPHHRERASVVVGHQGELSGVPGHPITIALLYIFKQLTINVNCFFRLAHFCVGCGNLV